MCGIVFPRLPQKESQSMWEDRVIFETFGYEIFTASQVAEILGISNGGAYKFLYRRVRDNKGYEKVIKNGKICFCIKKGG